ncbi:MAG: hypothetical protein JO337_01795 [Acidimicrobiales bacterium]|nr:hypothetical protein [Acidimicrobiales bacterium]
MTANRSAKKAARALAQATGQTYSSARRSERSAWATALDEHAELLRFWESPLALVLGGQILASGRRTYRFSRYIADARAAGPFGGDVEVDESQVPQTEEEFDAALAQFQDQVVAVADRVLGPFDRDRDSALVVAEQTAAVKEATTFAVTTDMVTLVEHAAPSMPVETVERSDVPCPNGFVYLEKPFSLISDSGKAIPQRALHWTVASDEVTVVCYRRRDDYAEGEETLNPTDAAMLPRLLVGTEWTWRFGDPSFGGFPGGDDSAVPQLAQFLKALWAISAQRLAATETARPDRQTLRRAQRAGMVTAGAVRVVQLRRQEHSASAGPVERAVDWTHRWLVNGHWRNQYLPGCGLHRQQWIDTHVKGPEGLPLVVKPTIFNVAR